MKIIFFGTEEFSAPTLRALIAAKYDIACVVTKPDTARGRGRHIDSPLVAKIAAEHAITVLQPEKLGGFADELRKFGAEIGVLVSYGKIIPQSVIDVFPRGIVNIHPSLLPKYRGPSPMEAAIANGDTETGITLMSLQREMDAGSIYFQEKIALNGTETKPGLYEKFSQLGAELLIENLPKIISGELKPTPQNDSEATYCQLLSRADGILDPATMTAAECERKVRAYLGFPRTRINLSFLLDPRNKSEDDNVPSGDNGSLVIITRAKVLPNFAGDEWPDVIPCANNTYLQILELVAPNSGKQMKTADYLRGLKV